MSDIVDAYLKRAIEDVLHHEEMCESGLVEVDNSKKIHEARIQELHKARRELQTVMKNTKELIVRLGKHTYRVKNGSEVGNGTVEFIRIDYLFDK